MDCQAVAMTLYLLYITVADVSIGVEVLVRDVLRLINSNDIKVFRVVGLVGDCLAARIGCGYECSVINVAIDDVCAGDAVSGDASVSVTSSVINGSSVKWWS